MIEDVFRIWAHLSAREKDLLDNDYRHDYRSHTPYFDHFHDEMDSFDEYISRTMRVQRAFSESKQMAMAQITQRLGDIGLADIQRILLDLCEEIALYVGGSAVLGGVIGGVVGAFAGGVGAAPGAYLGAGAGAEVGSWILGLLGLKTLLEGLCENLPLVVKYYRQGFREAWGPSRDEELFDHYSGKRGSVFFAACTLARGHEILIVSLRSALVAYLTRGRADRSLVLREIRQNPRLGPRVAAWWEKNEQKRLNHPQLNPRQSAPGPAGGQTAHANRSTGPAVTPSQLWRSQREMPNVEGRGRVEPSEHLTPKRTEPDGSAVLDGKSAPDKIDPAVTAGSIRTVNPNYPQSGFSQNCVNCVIATEKRFAGDTSAAASQTSGPLPISQITDEFGGSFENVSGMMEIGSTLSRSGNGREALCLELIMREDLAMFGMLF